MKKDTRILWAPNCNSDSFKTVDELVEYYLDGKTDIFDIIDFMIFVLYDMLLKILQSKSNEPSRFDLYIITSAKGMIDRKGLSSDHTRTMSKCIISVCKNRKVL